MKKYILVGVLGLLFISGSISSAKAAEMTAQQKADLISQLETVLASLTQQLLNLLKDQGMVTGASVSTGGTDAISGSASTVPACVKHNYADSCITISPSQAIGNTVNTFTIGAGDLFFHPRPSVNGTTYVNRIAAGSNAEDGSGATTALSSDAKTLTYTTFVPLVTGSDGQPKQFGIEIDTLYDANGKAYLAGATQAVYVMNNQ